MSTRFHSIASMIAVATAVAAGGCVDNRASIEIQHICQPSNDCTFTATCDEALSYPTLDATVSPNATLALYLQVANQNVNNANAGIGRANTNDAHVDEEHVEFDRVPLPPTTIGASYEVPAAGTSVIKFEAIPRVLNASSFLAAFAPTPNPVEIVARIRLRGYYDDGTRFETGEFPIAIRICSGCLTASACATCPPSSSGQLPLVCLQ